MQIEEVSVLHEEMQLMRHYNSRWKVDFFCMDSEEMHTDF